MFRKEVNEQSPLRILDSTTSGGLGAGKLGVVMARAGVGKTAFLVQVGLDDAMRERPVLHVGLGQDIEHIQSWYDALFEDLVQLNGLDEPSQVRALVNKNRLIQTYADADAPHERLDDVVRLFSEKLDFSPSVILIDGFDWESGSVVTRAAQIGALKIIAKRLGAELWMSAQTHREETPERPRSVMEPCTSSSELIDVAVFLEPEGTHVSVRLVKDHDETRPADTHLHLDSDTMRLVSDAAADVTQNLPAGSFTLLSGGAAGTEAFFGEAAERHGLDEVHFTFPGRESSRARGVVELTRDELERGAVSEAYVQAQLHRSFPKTEKFQKLLKSIWHQVATAGEVFVVGQLQDDQTVKGGTGWGAELARHFHKRLHVFDQNQEQWFHWNDGAWQKVETPRIQKTRFCGTGTRDLSDVGRAAINKLFENSFG